VVREVVVLEGLVRINGAARGAGEGTGLGTKAVLGDCAGRVNEGVWGPKPMAVCCAVSEGLAGAIDSFTVGGCGIKGLLLAGIFSCGIVGWGAEGLLVAGMDAGVDSFGELAATAAGIVPVGVFDDDAFESSLRVSTVAPCRPRWNQSLRCAAWCP
jgi:hypothetical protein